MPGTLWLADHFLAITAAQYVPAREAMPIVREEARKALEIDPSLPEAHAILGIVAGAYDYDWKEAGRHFDLAMAQDLIPPRVRAWYGFFFICCLQAG